MHKCNECKNQNKVRKEGKKYYKCEKYIKKKQKSSKYAKQAEAVVVPSSSLVQFKIESDLVCLRFLKFDLD